MNEHDALAAARAGDSKPVADLFHLCRVRLARMIELRIDPHVRARVDADDVLQETFVEVMHRLPEYLARPTLPFFLWIRFLAVQKLLQLHRTHLDAAARDANRELSLPSGSWLASDAGSIASAWFATNSTPSAHAVRDETRARVQAALATMKPIDREVLVLRHFEQLTNVETAQLLGLQEPAASRRYLRALGRMRDALDGWAQSPGATSDPHE